jgi:hypothetical protein
MRNNGNTTINVFLRKAAKKDQSNLFAENDSKQFKISIESVILKPNDSKLIHISFVSDFYGAFSCNLEVFINEEMFQVIELVALAYQVDTDQEEFSNKTE